MNIWIIFSLISVCRCARSRSSLVTRTRNEFSLRLRNKSTGRPSISETEMDSLLTINFDATPFAASLLGLLSELKENIFSYLLFDGDCFVSLRRTCKNFKEIIRKMLVTELIAHTSIDFVFLEDNINYLMYYFVKSMLNGILSGHEKASLLDLNEDTIHLHVIKSLREECPIIDFNFYSFSIKGSFIAHLYIPFISSLAFVGDETVASEGNGYLTCVLVDALHKKPLPKVLKYLASSGLIPPEKASFTNEILDMIASNDFTKSSLLALINHPQFNTDLLDHLRMAIITFCVNELGFADVVEEYYNLLVEFLDVGYFCQELFDRIPVESEWFKKLFDERKLYRNDQLYRNLYEAASEEILLERNGLHLLKYFWTRSAYNPFKLRVFSNFLAFQIGEIFSCNFPNIEQLNMIVKIGELFQGDILCNEKSFSFHLFAYGGPLVVAAVLEESKTSINMFTYKKDDRTIKHLFHQIKFSADHSYWKLKMYLSNFNSNVPIPLLFMRIEDLIQVLPDVIETKKFDFSIYFDFSAVEEYVILTHELLVPLWASRINRYCSFIDLVAMSSCVELKSIFMKHELFKDCSRKPNTDSPISVEKFIETAIIQESKNIEQCHVS